MVDIGIIGGGFTGAAVAVHLANAARAPLRIEVVEPRADVGLGLAYGSCRSEHRINVPSDRMVVFREEPLHFTDWLRAAGILDADAEGHVEGGDFYSRRADFGAYMAALFRKTAERNPSGSSLQHRRAAASAFDRDGAGWRVRFTDGTLAYYSQLVLAQTHAPPALYWPVGAEASASPNLIANPWDWDAIAAVPERAHVAILGTGLTMCDVVVTLRANGHRGNIEAISRRGLTPRVHGLFGMAFDLFGTEAPPDTAIGLLRLLRARIREAAAAGLGWHPVVDELRSRLPIYWRTLPLSERIKIARRLRAWWDVHRFRIAPQVHRLIAGGETEGWLAIHRGHVHGIDGNRDGLRLDWTPRHEQRRETGFDVIINCTGPDSDIARSAGPMLRHALDAGFIRPDPLRIGIDVDADGRAIDRGGSAGASLWVAGPLARAVVGEATGLPEASDSARKAANGVAASVGSAVSR